MHILLVRFSSMGDVVLQTATINWLKALWGKSITITFVTSREFAPLISGHPAVQRVIEFDRRQESWKSFISKVRELDDEKPIDLILDLHATLRSWRLKLALWSIPALTVDKRRWERFLLTVIKSVGLRQIFHAEAFGLEPQVKRILNDWESIFDDPRAVRRTADFRQGAHQELTSLRPLPPYDLPENTIVLAPSASFAPKRWAIESFVQLASELLEKTSSHIVVLAGPGDDFCRAFDVINSERLHNLQGKTSLKESMSVLSKSKLCIGNDSGMNHIAEAYGVPCLTLFGPTDPRFGFAPHGTGSAFISKELWCKPCSTTGKKPCYRERHFCMEMISVSEVTASALKLLSEEQHVS